MGEAFGLARAGVVEVDARDLCQGGKGRRRGGAKVVDAGFEPRVAGPRANCCGGTGFIAQVEPAGSVPVSTHVPAIGQRVPLFHCSACFVRSKASGVR